METTTTVGNVTVEFGAFGTEHRLDRLYTEVTVTAPGLSGTFLVHATDSDAVAFRGLDTALPTLTVDGVEYRIFGASEGLPIDAVSNKRFASPAVTRRIREAFKVLTPLVPAPERVLPARVYAQQMELVHLHELLAAGEAKLEALRQEENHFWETRD